MSLEGMDAMTEAMVRADRIIREAIEFTERHGFKSYRLGMGNSIGTSKYHLGEVHANVNAWAFRGSKVEFDEEAGTIAITHPDALGRHPFTYHGRKSK
jgi:hypothetical protein